jgi:hypothetical protein
VESSSIAADYADKEVVRIGPNATPKFPQPDWSLQLSTLDTQADHRMKAEACRRLADLTDDPQRKELWIERADYWERLAAKAPKKQKSL